MESKLLILPIYLIILVWQISSQIEIAAQEETLQDSSNEPLSALLQPENPTNLAQNSHVLILIPSNTNLSEWRLNDANYNLYKLNSNLLFKRDHVNMDETIDGLIEEDHHKESEFKNRVVRDLNGARESRKMNLLGGIWNKPRVSPLYLINGTVCRYVNGAPVCTTLSTSGLLPGGSGTTTARPAASGLQGGGGSAVQFASTTTPQPRPAGLMDDDAQDINVGAIFNSTGGSMIVRDQQQQLALRPVAAISTQTYRPVNLVGRRPLNLLALRRPVRRYQAVSGRTSGQSISAINGVQYQLFSRGGRQIM